MDKQEIVAGFQKAFDVVKLSSEIIERITTPAETNRSYIATLTKIENGKSKLGRPYKVIEMMTDKREVLTSFVDDLPPQFEVGKRYRVFYTGDQFPKIEFLERLSS